MSDFLTNSLARDQAISRATASTSAAHLLTNATMIPRTLRDVDLSPRRQYLVRHQGYHQLQPRRLEYHLLLVLMLLPRHTQVHTNILIRIPILPKPPLHHAQLPHQAQWQARPTPHPPRPFGLPAPSSGSPSAPSSASSCSSYSSGSSSANAPAATMTTTTKVHTTPPRFPTPKSLPSSCSSIHLTHGKTSTLPKQNASVTHHILIRRPGCATSLLGL